MNDGNRTTPSGASLKRHKSPPLREAAAEVVSAFDAMVNERVALDGATYETERLCEFRETYLQRLRVALAMAERRGDDA